VLIGEGGGGGAVVGAGLLEDVADMDPDGMLTELQYVRDLPIALSRGYQSQDL
jgi:hypothetical protein